MAQIGCCNPNPLIPSQKFMHFSRKCGDFRPKPLPRLVNLPQMSLPVSTSSAHPREIHNPGIVIQLGHFELISQLP